MDKTTQDLAWSVIPKEFKEEVKNYYDNSPVLGVNAVLLLENLFGVHNLTSDAVGEEMLYVKRSEIIERYRALTHPEDEYESPQRRANIFLLQDLFGSKCLPDEKVPNPTPLAEPKYHVGDKAILKGYVCTITGIVFEQGKLIGYKIESPQLHGNATVPEDYLEPYTEPKEDNHFDNIIKDGFSKERRLNIAKDFASVLLSRLNYDPFTAQINCCCSDGATVNPYINIARIAFSVADALIAESEKGGSNA